MCISRMPRSPARGSARCHLVARRVGRALRVVAEHAVEDALVRRVELAVEDEVRAVAVQRRAIGVGHAAQREDVLGLEHRHAVGQRHALAGLEAIPDAGEAPVTETDVDVDGKRVGHSVLPFEGWGGAAGRGAGRGQNIRDRGAGQAGRPRTARGRRWLPGTRIQAGLVGMVASTVVATCAARRRGGGRHRAGPRAPVELRQYGVRAVVHEDDSVTEYQVTRTRCREIGSAMPGGEAAAAPGPRILGRRARRRRWRARHPRRQPLHLESRARRPPACPTPPVEITSTEVFNALLTSCSTTTTRSSSCMAWTATGSPARSWPARRRPRTTRSCSPSAATTWRR